MSVSVVMAAARSKKIESRREIDHYAKIRVLILWRHRIIACSEMRSKKMCSNSGRFPAENTTNVITFYWLHIILEDNLDKI